MKKVMLIVNMSTLNWGESNAGGVDSVCQMIVSHLSGREDSEYEYRVLAFDSFNVAPYTGKVIRLSPYVEVVVCPKNEKRLGVKLPGFISQILRVHEQISDFKPDVVHAHEALWLIGVRGGFLRLATLHGYKRICRKPVSFANDFLYVHILPWVTDFFVDIYTCVGSELRFEVKKYVDKPVELVGNPLDDFYFSNGILGKKSCGELKLVTCAIISRRKCIERVIALVADLVGLGLKVTLNVIGPSQDPVYMRELESVISSLLLEDKVFFSGALSRREIYAEYKSSDIGVFYSGQESFGLAPLEMLATGLPLSTTEVGILAERKDEFQRLGVNYYVGESNEQVSSFLRLLNYNSEPMVAWLKCNFSCSAVVAAYEKLYRDNLC